MTTSSYEQEQKALEQAIFQKLPKEIKKLACNLGTFSDQSNVTPHNIINKAQEKLIESDQDIQALVQTFNQRHPNNPYNPDTFGQPVQAPIQKALTTQFKHSVEVAAAKAHEKPFLDATSKELSTPNPPKIKPK